jgi:SPP1 family predicted phage head-tail adaptor
MRGPYSDMKGPALPQRLRHRIDVQELVTVQDSDTGAVTEAWASILQSDEPLIPAAIYPLSGREYVAAEAIQAQVNTRITIRYRADVIPSMRVLHESVTYNIKAVLPDPTLRRHITLMCESGVNAG